MNKINKLIEGLEKLTGKIVRLESKEGCGCHKEKQAQKKLKESYPKEMDNYPRPPKMKRPDISGMTKSATAYWPNLYIQDEAKDILIDKYGKSKGEKYFQGLIDTPNRGAFYQAVTQIVMEKAKMLRDLGEPLGNDYFEHNYFAVWSKWMDEVVKPQFNKQSKNPRSSSSGNAGYDEKDMRRIEDIIKKAGGNREKEERLATIMANKITDKAKAIRRAKAAEDENYHNIAKIFYNRAKMLN